MASPIKPTKPSAIIEVVEPILEDLEAEENEAESETESKIFDSENPWDLVPDQPAKIDTLNPKIEENWPLKTEKIEENWPLKTDKEAAVGQNGQNLMDDPFDADWVSLALNQTNNHN